MAGNTIDQKGLIWPERRKFLKRAPLLFGGVALAAMPKVATAAALLRGSAIPTPVQSKPTVPGPAAAWGFNNLTFFDDFLSLSTIDVNNTLQPGFNWYVQSLNLGTYPTNTLIAFAASSFKVNGSILTYTPNTPVNDPVSGGNIYCAGYKSDNTFVGNTIQPTGWYAECRMAYDHTLATGTWFPAFWMWDKGIMYNSGTNTAYPASGLSEIDIFEYHSAQTYYLDYHWSSGSTQGVANPGGFGTGVPAQDDGFHTYGMLWVPMARNSGTGLMYRYCDGVEVVPPRYTYTSGQPMSGTDASTMGFTVQLQTGSNCPIYVDYVQIWQP